MLKIFSFSLFVLATLQGGCPQKGPVCGVNGVTYQNICRCREAKVDVGYKGVCQVQAKVEWVKSASDDLNKNIYHYRPSAKAAIGPQAVPLKWQDYSWDSVGWGDASLL